MRLISLALWATIAVGLFAGCSGSNLGSASSMPSTGAAESHLVNGHFVPRWSRPASLIPPELRPSGPAAVLTKLVPNRLRVTSHLYVSLYNSVYINGYKMPNKTNSPSTCFVTPVSFPDGIAVDDAGNLIDADSGTFSIIIFKGPGMCGPELGAISDPYGQPGDVASANAATGKIAVANIFDNSGAAGSISICTFSGGCTANLTNANMSEVAGVAMAKNGDCWASAVDQSGHGSLTYFHGCTGGGTAATGFMNTYYGGLDIDSAGNLVSISAFNSKVYVYKGCNPACTLVGGPFSLFNEALFGHLDKYSKHFAAADFKLSQIDVYTYSPTNITHSYSFNNGLSPSYRVEGAAFKPRSEE